MVKPFLNISDPYESIDFYITSTLMCNLVIIIIQAGHICLKIK